MVPRMYPTDAYIVRKGEFQAFTWYFLFPKLRGGNCQESRLKIPIFQAIILLTETPGNKL